MPKHRASNRKKSNNSSSAKWWLLWLGLLAFVLIINYAIRPPAPSAPKAAHLIDTDRPLEVFGTPGWGYHQTLEYDLDADGVNETIAIIAAVSKDDRGRYAWDDGQPWQVYIKDGDDITHIYNRYVQLGGLDVFITFEQPPRIGIVENQGAGHTLYVVTYQGTGEYHAEELVNLPVIQRMHSLWGM